MSSTGHSEACEESVNSATPSAATSTTTPPASPPSPTRRAQKIADRQKQGVLVLLVKNAYPRVAPKRYCAMSLEKLLRDAVQILGLTSHAKRAFREDGSVLKSLEELGEMETLYISCGEKFGQGMPSPKKASPTSSPKRAEESPKKEEKKEEKVESPPASPTKENKVKKEIESFTKIVAMSTRTTDETMKEATASVYASLDKAGKKRLSSLQQLHDDVQGELLVHHLLRQSIAPKVVTDLHDITGILINKLKLLSMDEVKFAIAGPKQSGKTTVLYALASLLARKLQVSDEASQYLFFPVNFEVEVCELQSHQRLLRLFVATMFQALEYSSLKILPYLEALKRWFTLCVFGSYLTVPDVVAECGLFNVTKLQELAKSVSAALKKDDDHALEEFMALVCEMPGLFAEACGLRGVIYVLDSFEFCDITITPGREVFPRSLKPVNLAQCMCKVLSKSPYLVSMQDEQSFLQAFTCNDCEVIDMCGLIPDQVCDAYIATRQPAMRLKISDCMGAPGYIGAFKKLLERVEQMEEHAAFKTSYSMTKTAADLSRKKLIKQELIRLAGFLLVAGNDEISKHLLNELADSEQFLVRSVLEDGEEPAAEEEERPRRAEAPPPEQAETPKKGSEPEEEDSDEEPPDAKSEKKSGIQLTLKKASPK